MAAEDQANAKLTCPACGGAGGGPIGRAGAGWDIESYECVRCGGEGWVTAASEAEHAARIAAAAAAAAAAKSTTPKPGLVKAAPLREVHVTAQKKTKKSAAN